MKKTRQKAENKHTFDLTAEKNERLKLKGKFAKTQTGWTGKIGNEGENSSKRWKMNKHLVWREKLEIRNQKVKLWKHLWKT